ncbi:hypothetical protein Y600_6160 [Burkholderia pseudomallei MSHR3709]|nr:hypothetical protein Y600_6160 [Burkholderia pseudomallei MSHR3709]
MLLRTTIVVGTRRAERLRSAAGEPATCLKALFLRAIPLCDPVSGIAQPSRNNNRSGSGDHNACSHATANHATNCGEARGNARRAQARGTRSGNGGNCATHTRSSAADAANHCTRSFDGRTFFLYRHFKSPQNSTVPPVRDGICGVSEPRLISGKRPAN